ncbi:nucleotidyl transferase AbiEii/AbiGii toxin family protein [Microbulbifer sp. VAAC004]|uniref:nucleotidyl transferase AbiEii/AbiGii toxin family protein n=1 Tax=unclassified Microbulbifer TaxID=2619833 RepID=UPI0040391A22
MTNILNHYTSNRGRKELADLLRAGAQYHPASLPAQYLEKDLWVVEILRLLYDEELLGGMDVAFKGGTALSKCFSAIDRFSEDIDLSIHWGALAKSEDEAADWKTTTQSGNQKKKFRNAQTKRLEEWTQNLVDTLNARFTQYGIDRLSAEYVTGSKGEQVEIHYPRLITEVETYTLDYVLLEFGGRNRGKPTVRSPITCYLTEVPELAGANLSYPTASVSAYHPDYILCEKLTALHQFSTQTKEPDPYRLARHWSDTDKIIIAELANPFETQKAMEDVVTMKSARWSEKGVEFEAVLRGELKLIPDQNRLALLTADHEESLEGGMFLQDPGQFQDIVARLKQLESKLNAHYKSKLSNNKEPK